MFQTLTEILKETKPGPSFSHLVYESISAFKSLSIISQAQKKKKKTGEEWICESIVSKSGESTLFMLDHLLEIANGGGLKSMFKTTSNCHIFWIKVEVEYPEPATKALEILLPFTIYYFCEVE